MGDSGAYCNGAAIAIVGDTKTHRRKLVEGGRKPGRDPCARDVEGDVKRDAAGHVVAREGRSRPAEVALFHQRDLMHAKPRGIGRDGQ